VNVYSDEHDVDRGVVRLTHVGRRIGAEDIGATVFDADPGVEGVYHLHHGNEEWLIVLEGAPTLRTSDGEHQLRPGDVAVFPRGPDGLHAIANRSDSRARWLVVSTMLQPDVTERPDEGLIGVFAGDVPTAGVDAPLELFFRREDAVGPRQATST
jgi:uncharacterized cupin superfamily protein